MAHPKYISYKVVPTHWTDNAVLVKVDDENLWIPRACLAWETDEAIKRGDSITELKIVDWWAHKHGLD